MLKPTLTGSHRQPILFSANEGRFPTARSGSSNPRRSDRLVPTRTGRFARGWKGAWLLVWVLACLACLSGSARADDRKPNVLLICIDDLRPELRCFGADYIHSPNLDRLAANGRVFDHHYVQAPTCGASRYALLTGRYGPAGNDALFKRSERLRAGARDVPPDMPGWFRQHGYRTVSVGKVSHHPGGQGGPDWDADDQPEMPGSWDASLLTAGPWQHPRGWMHGLARGEIRTRAEQMDVFQSTDGPDEIYPDGVSIDEALKQLDQLSQDSQRPFFLAVGILRPHLPLGAPARYLQQYDDVTLPPIAHPDRPTWRTTWHASGEFMKYNRWGRNPNTDPEFADAVRRHYAACVSYADAQVGKLMKQLENSPAGKNTIIVVWGDHGWHLGEHAVWGKHTLFEESLRSPLLIQFPGIPRPGEKSPAVVETIDLFPTLCELTAVPTPTDLQGGSLEPLLRDPHGEWDGTGAIAYQGNAATIRTDRYRLIQHGDGYVELYDHASASGETLNVADRNDEVVSRLTQQLRGRLENR